MVCRGNEVRLGVGVRVRGCVSSEPQARVEFPSFVSFLHIVTLTLHGRAYEWFLGGHARPTARRPPPDRPHHPNPSISLHHQPTPNPPRTQRRDDRVGPPWTPTFTHARTASHPPPPAPPRRAIHSPPCAACSPAANIIDHRNGYLYIDID